MCPHSKIYVSNSDIETRHLGALFGASLAANSVVTFFGELGAGKTTFIKGMAASIAKCQEDEVSSPTFAYLNIYDGLINVYHFDLYRLQNEEAFLSMGFDEFFFADGVCCIEWSERIAQLIPKESARVHIKHISPEQRSIEIFWEPANS